MKRLIIAIAILFFILLNLPAQDLPPAVEQAKEYVFMYQIDLTLHGTLIEENYNYANDTVYTYTKNLGHGNAVQISDYEILTVSHNFPTSEDLIRQHFAGLQTSFVRHDTRFGYWPLRLDSLAITHRLISSQGQTYQIQMLFGTVWEYQKIEDIDLSSENIEYLMYNMYQLNAAPLDSTFIILDIMPWQDLMLLAIYPPLPRDKYLLLEPTNLDTAAYLYSPSAAPSFFHKPFNMYIAQGKFLTEVDHFKVDDNELFVKGAVLEMNTFLGNSGSAVITSDGHLCGLTFSWPEEERWRTIASCLGGPQHRNIILYEEIENFLRLSKTN